MICKLQKSKKPQNSRNRKHVHINFLFHEFLGFWFFAQWYDIKPNSPISKCSDFEIWRFWILYFLCFKTTPKAAIFRPELGYRAHQCVTWSILPSSRDCQFSFLKDFYPFFYLLNPPPLIYYNHLFVSHLIVSYIKTLMYRRIVVFMNRSVMRWILTSVYSTFFFSKGPFLDVVISIICQCSADVVQREILRLGFAFCFVVVVLL